MTVPNCPDCQRPLGLYYAECSTCLDHAWDYTLADYEGPTDDTPPTATEES